MLCSCGKKMAKDGSRVLKTTGETVRKWVCWTCKKRQKEIVGKAVEPLAFASELKDAMAQSRRVLPLEPPPVVKQYKRPSYTLGIPRREFFVSDIHFPYQCDAAWGVFLEAVRAEQPDLIFFGGDATDFYPISRFDKDPVRKLSLQSEIDVAVHELTRVRMAAPNARIVYLPGNHDLRLEKFIGHRAEELSCLRSLHLAELLRLKENDIEYLDAGAKTKIGALWHFHGHEIPGAGANPAMAKLNKFWANLIAGHLHVVQRFFRRTGDGQLIGAFMNGCLCATDVEYALHHNWIQGFSVIDYITQGSNAGDFFVHDALIFKRPGVAWTQFDGRRVEVQVKAE